MFARIKWCPFGTETEVICETREKYFEMVEWLVDNKCWFDTDFPSETRN
jgi:hypothetical protein